jgi:hypothetical protein
MTLHVQAHHPIIPLSRLQKMQLLADLKQNRVANRKQGGATLSYIEAWDARAMLIRVFGFGGWSSEIVSEGTKVLRMDHDIPALDYKTKEQKSNPDGTLQFNWRVTAQATMALYIHQLGAIYSEVAIASQTGPDVGEVADFAIKTAESDAFKRAAMNLGTQFGLSLYNEGSLGDVVMGLLNEGEKMVTLKTLREEGAPTAAPSSTAGQPVEEDRPMAFEPPSNEAQAAAANQVAGAFGPQS